MKIKNQDKTQVQTFLQITELDLPEGTVEEKEMSEISGGLGGVSSGPGYSTTWTSGLLGLSGGGSTTVDGKTYGWGWGQ